MTFRFRFIDFRSQNFEKIWFYKVLNRDNFFISRPNWGLDSWFCSLFNSLSKLLITNSYQLPVLELSILNVKIGEKNRFFRVFKSRFPVLSSERKSQNLCLNGTCGAESHAIVRKKSYFKDVSFVNLVYF